MKKDNNCTRRNEIIKTAYDLLLEKGYEDMGVQDILDRMGITKGCLYYHFKSKRDIASAVITETIKPHFEKLWKDICKDTDPLQGIIDAVDRIFLTKCERLAKFGCPLGNLTAELSAKDAMLSKSISKIISSWQLFIETALDKAIDLKIVRSGINVSKISKFITASFEGCIMMAKSSQDKTVLEDCFSVLKDYLSSLRK